MDNAESIDNLEEEIRHIVNKELEDNAAYIGINIGLHGGTNITSQFKKDKEIELTDSEISAATSSLLFLSSKMLQEILNQKISFNAITGKNKIIVTVLTDTITLIAFLNRELAELEGLDQYMQKIKDLALKISAIVETSDIIREECFVAVKRAIPDALMIAIINKEGLPLKIQSHIPEPMLAAMISAIYNLSEILSHDDFEYTIISAENGSIIIHKLDDYRILSVAVPEAGEKNLGKYIAKIKEIIEIS
ncbi:MAG: hypothetical protein ACTSVV_15845 [Promethearchaeota archaeon]